MHHPTARLALSAALASFLASGLAVGAGAETPQVIEQWAACPSGKTVTVLADRNAGQVAATVGDRIRVVLPVQTGTGYTWQLAPDGTAALVAAGRMVQPAPSARPGAPGAMAFLLDAARVGTQRLQFQYRRPWERTQPPARTFAVTVTVKGC